MAENTGHCALYIDYGGLATILNRRRIFRVPIADLVDAFKREASQYGDLIFARAFADWTRHEGASVFEQLGVEAKFTAPGQRFADFEIGADAGALIRSNAAINTFIIVANAEQYVAPVQSLRAQGSQVVIWGIPEVVSSLLRNTADRFTPIEQLLPLTLEKPTLVIPRQFMLTALAITLDNQMSLLGVQELPRERCVERLNALPHFTPHGQAWLNQALEEGLVTEIQAPYDSACVLCLSNDRHPKVRLALDARDRLLLTMDSVLHGRRWVAFNTLERYLRSQAIFGANEASRRLWIELLISEDLILAEKRVNLNRPEFAPTTALTLNQDHPVMQEIPKLINNQLQRLIVIVNQFLINRSYQWIAASTLLRIMESYLTRASAQEIFSLAHDDQIILLEKLNQPTHSVQPVTIVQLNQRNKLVQNTLHQRDRAIRILEKTLQPQGGGLSYTALIANLQGRHFGVSDAYRSFWLDVLIRSEILKKAKIHENRRDEDVYYLNRSLPVVSAALRVQQ